MQIFRLAALSCLALATLVFTPLAAIAQTDEPSLGTFPEQRASGALPLTTPGYSYELKQQPLSISQQRAIFAANQRMLRMEYNNWIGYSPLRPNVNASYMSQSSPRFYQPTRGQIYSFGGSRMWYW